MIFTVNPRQNRLFDPFEGVIPPAGRKIVEEGWQGVLRHVLLEMRATYRITGNPKPIS